MSHIIRRSLFPLLLAVVVYAQDPAAARKGAPPPRMWADPVTTAPPGMQYKTFRSAIAAAEVSYLVYLPPGYEPAGETRYPVIYWLHGLNGSPRVAAPFVAKMDQAIRAGTAPPAVIVSVNGVRDSMYCDSRDGKLPVESVIIQELIPHVDSAYRTLTRREARAVEGFSMGGFGAAHLGFKYPDLFGVVGCLAGALHDADSFSERRTALFHDVFGGDREYLDANTPKRLVEENAARVRGRTRVRIAVGDQDPTTQWNIAYHEQLTRLKISHEFDLLPGIGHNAARVYEALGAKTAGFYTEAFRSLAAPD